MSWRRILKIIYPTDLITIGYLLITGVFIFLSALALENPFSHLLYRLIYILCIGGIILLHFFYPKRLIKITHAFYPLVLLPLLYSETDTLNNVFFFNLDPMVANIEATIFRGYPSIWLSQMFPWQWLSEIMHVAYFSFYILVFYLFYRIYKFKNEYFTYASFVFCFSYYIYFIIFIVFPVAGPQYYFSSPENQPREGYIFSQAMTYIHDYLKCPTAGFPSSFVGILGILWYLCIKFDRKLLTWYIPLGLLLIVSTIYIKIHYVVDVIAGILTIPTMYWVSKNTYEILQYTLDQEFKIAKIYEATKFKTLTFINRAKGKFKKN